MGILEDEFGGHVSRKSADNCADLNRESPRAVEALIHT